MPEYISHNSQLTVFRTTLDTLGLLGRESQNRIRLRFKTILSDNEIFTSALISHDSLHSLQFFSCSNIRKWDTCTNLEQTTTQLEPRGGDSRAGATDTGVMERAEWAEPGSMTDSY